MLAIRYYYNFNLLSFHPDSADSWKLLIIVLIVMLVISALIAILRLNIAVHNSFVNPFQSTGICFDLAVLLAWKAAGRVARALAAPCRIIVVPELLPMASRLVGLGLDPLACIRIQLDRHHVWSLLRGRSPHKSCTLSSFAQWAQRIPNWGRLLLWSLKLHTKHIENGISTVEEIDIFVFMLYE